MLNRHTRAMARFMDVARCDLIIIITKSYGVGNSGAISAGGRSVGELEMGSLLKI